MALAGTAIIEFRGDFSSLQASGRRASADTERSVLGSFKSIAKKAGPILAAVGAVKVFEGMISEAREAAKVTRITENAIRATGGSARVTAKDVGVLSTALSMKAGIDDEVIQTGANMLLTFRNVRNEVGKGNDIFDRAVASATDLSVQFGSVDSTSKMLGKALNDPLKGLVMLGRAGVTFSETQKDQIKNFVRTGDLLSAQKVILSEVEHQVGGAAAAAADPLDKLKVAWGNLLEQAGTKVLPWIGDVGAGLAEKLPNAIGTAERAVGGLVTKGVDLAQTFWRNVEPAVDDVWSALGNLRDIAAEVIDFGAPLAEGFLILGGAAVVGGIRGTAKALELVSGFLADNKVLIDLMVAGVVTFAALQAWGLIVSAVETIYIQWLILQGAVGGSVILNGLRMIGAGFLTMGGDAALGAGMVRGGMATVAASTAVATGGLVVLAAGFVALFKGISNGHAQAAEQIKDLQPKDFDPASLRSIGEYSSSVGAASSATNKLVASNEGWRGTLKGTIQLLTPLRNTVTDASYAYGDLSAAQEKLRGQGIKLEDKYRAVWESVTGKKVTDGLDLTGNNIDAFSKKIGEAQGWVGQFDLDPTKLTAAELTKAIKSNLKDLAEDAGYRGPQIKAAMELSPDELKAQKKQWEDLSKTVSGAWSSQLDVVSAFSGRESSQKVQAEVDKMRAGVQESIAGIKSDLAESVKGMSIEDAAKATTDAQGRIDDALAKGKEAVKSYTDEHGISSAQISTWYTEQATQATTFAQNIGTAMQQGYDPALISRLLQAGPAQAAPLLQQMVQDHANGLVGIVNEGETALSRLSTLAVDMARIQNLAMNSQTDDMTRNMGLGLKETEAVSRLGAFATADAVAQELGIGRDRVEEIAKQYGITLADAINPVLSAVGVGVITLGPGGRPNQSIAAATHRNSGGPIYGPNVNRDVVPVMLTPGEFVVRKSMVDKMGLGAMAALNAGRTPAGWRVPGFNAGGLIPAPPTIGLWPLARGAEGAMGIAYRAASAAAAGFSHGGQVRPVATGHTGTTQTITVDVDARGIQDPETVGQFAATNIAWRLAQTAPR